MIRRLAAALAAALALAGAPARAEPGVTPTEIVIGQSVDLSGTISSRMKPLTQAIDAYLAQVNAAGGVHGRRLRLVRLDDNYKPERTLENARRLVDQEGAFALFAVAGTAQVERILPWLDERKVPLIGTTSGADAFYRKTWPWLINAKASYGDEIEAIVRHLSTLGTRKVALAYVDNGAGRALLAAAREALARRKLEPAGVAAFAEDTHDVAQAAASIAASAPEAVLLLTLAGPAPRLVEAWLATGARAQLYGISVMSSDALHKAVGERARGIAVTQIAPWPWSIDPPLAREYQETMARAGVKELSMSGIEGFMMARVLVEGLRAAGPAPTRAGLVQAYERMRRRDLGGVPFDFGPGDHNGTSYVELTIIGPGGKLMR